MKTFLEAATFYIGLGWKVLPLCKAAKIPAIAKADGGNGWKDATDDPAIIADWARRFPNANIGIATGKVSGIVVVDFDKRNGGFATLARLARDGLVFPPCPEAKTGNAGRHLVFAYRPDIAASKNKLGAGVDIKSDGGYIVAAPSWIGKSDQGDGGRYEWLKKPTSAPPELPYWFIEKMKPKPRPRFEPRATHEMAERSLEGMCAKVASAPQGDRNNVLNWATYNAGLLVKEHKIGAGIVEARLRQAAVAAGLPLHEVEKTIRSGLDGAMK
jgi:hypothetical protein